MTYAFITEGMDDERREQFDELLAAAGQPQKLQARRERALVDTLMKGPGRK